MEDNNTEQEKTEQFKKDFTKAVFETIRLWCTKEYEHSKKFKDAYNNWNTAEQDEKDNEIKKYLKDFQKFLNDYSIDRTRKAGKDNEMLKKFFDEIRTNLTFNSTMIDELASYFKGADCTPTKKSKKNPTKKSEPGLPTSLVAKTLFLYYPDKVALYDNNVTTAINIIYKFKKINFKKSIEHTPVDNPVDKIIYRYNVYFEKFKNFKGEYYDDGIKIIESILKDSKVIIEQYLKEYNKIFNPTFDDSVFQIIDGDHNDFLLHRSIDKYLWYFYEDFIKPKKESKKNETHPL